MAKDKATTEDSTVSEAVTVVAAAPALLESKTWEEWGEAKGMSPEFFPGRAGSANASGGLVPGFGKRHNPEFWKLAGARALRGWLPGKTVTEAEFDQAVTDAQGQTAR